MNVILVVLDSLRKDHVGCYGNTWIKTPNLDAFAEESALFESIEGKRGEPRNKPPYPTTAGLFGKPTSINNVETLANITAIIRNGAAWYKAIGTPSSPGTKVYTILGNVNVTGLIEVPMGITLREVISIYGKGMKDGAVRMVSG